MNAPETTPPSSRWLSGFLAFGSALVLLLTLLLGVASVVSTVGGATIWGPTTPCPTSAAVIGLCRLLVRRSDLINLPLLEASLAGIALLVGLWFIWVNHTETSLFHDSLVLQQFAEHLSAGDLSDFWPHIDNYAAKAPGDLYMSIYPHQAGLLLLMTGLRCLFGSGMVKALQVMNLLAAIGVSALLCSLARAVERPWLRTVFFPTCSSASFRTATPSACSSCWPPPGCSLRPSATRAVRARPPSGLPRACSRSLAS